MRLWQQRVHQEHVVTVPGEPVRDVPSDETRPGGSQDPHGHEARMKRGWALAAARSDHSGAPVVGHGGGRHRG